MVRSASSACAATPARSAPAPAEPATTAWQNGGAEAIVAMLSDDAKYAMPPMAEWYQGHHDIRAFILDVLTSRWRFLPAQANGQLAFGTCIWDDDRAAYVAVALDLLAIRATQVTEVVSFLTPEIFPNFGLPDQIREECPCSDEFVVRRRFYEHDG